MQAEGTAIRPGPRPAVGAALLTAIRHAMLSSHCMRLRYGVDPATARERVVEPLGLLHGQRPYLVAQITGAKQGASVFRLDRVHEHAVLQDTFVRDPAFSLQAYTQRSFGVWQEEPFAVCLRFSGFAAANGGRGVSISMRHKRWSAWQTGGIWCGSPRAGRSRCANTLVTWEDKVEVLEPAWLRTRTGRLGAQGR